MVRTRVISVEEARRDRLERDSMVQWAGSARGLDVDEREQWRTWNSYLVGCKHEASFIKTIGPWGLIELSNLPLHGTHGMIS